MNTSKLQSKLGLPLSVLLLLAVLPIPRALGHDLKLLDEGDLVNKILVFVPLIVWVVVVLWKKAPKPFMTLLAVGLIYGILLGIVHQITWVGFWNGNIPSVGGSLAGQISPTTEAIILRIVTFISSVITGLLTGVIIGVIALGMRHIQRTFFKK